ncbi:acyltransferase family protein [Myroides odoratimimus]|uniref:Acyltransferase n=1 Tax=Myroides odoratimimus TaxID=76832 RepID=A0AAI8G678_9FLAO|nr:acyltransferase family protein [Myroides odoratimimus]ALU28037.1 acyltransferase [Myroides odoratimimus]
MGFRYDIQGLRALAVLLVFIFHLNSSWLTGGFVGVDIFFVISGFLVSSIILHKKEKGTFGFVDFYIGRIKRIVPVFLLLLIFVGIIGSWVYLSGDVQGLRKNMFHAAIFNSNNYLAGLDNYFGASSQENPLLHTWTLSIEMQFYFLLPLFLILIKKKYIVPISLFIIVALFGYSFYNSAFLSNQSAMYFSLIARIPEFLIGTVFAVKANEIKKLIGKKQNVVALVSLIGIIVCGVLYTEHINFPGLWVVLPCVFAGTILVTTESKVNALFSNKVLVHIGELSYSIYLWHWAIKAFIRYYYVRVDFIWYEILGIVFLTYSLSWFSYTYVENVFRTYANKKFFVSFSSIVLFLGIVSFFMVKINNNLHNMPLDLAWHSFGVSSHGENYVKVDTLGDKKSKKTALLIGDSHALSYKGFLDYIGKQQDFNFISITNGRYPLFEGIKRNDFDSEKNFDTYERLIKEVSNYVHKVDVIFVSTTWSESVPSAPAAFNLFMQSLAVDKKVVFISDFPILNENPIRVNRDIKKRKSDIDFKPHIKDLPKEVLDVFKKHDNLYYLNLNYNGFLNELPYNNDTLMYFDATHINYFGSVKFGEKFENDVESFFKKNNILQN